jgi:hypothetical protein
VNDANMPGLIHIDNEEYLPNHQTPNLIQDIEDKSIANIFCVGAFADKTKQLHRQLPVHVAQWQHLFFCHVPL